MIDIDILAIKHIGWIDSQKQEELEEIDYPKVFWKLNFNLKVMKDNKLYSILDLIEEIDKVDKMIYLHTGSTSDLMLNQYKNQKLKLSNCLFKELLANSDNRPEVMYLIKIFIEKFYDNEINHLKFEENDNLKKIQNVFLENYS
ncbi:MAG: hypothetical protein ACOVLC_11450 [Flavobacterium sp.]